MDERALSRLALDKTRAAIEALEGLMMTDVWDALAPERQRAVAEATEAMRRDADRLEGLLR